MVYIIYTRNVELDLCKLLMVCTSRHLSSILLSTDIGAVEGITDIQHDNVSFQYLEKFSPHKTMCVGR